MHPLTFVSRCMNTLTGGSYRETYCARAWRLAHLNPSPFDLFWLVEIQMIDLLCVFALRETMHCYNQALAAHRAGVWGANTK